MVLLVLLLVGVAVVGALTAGSARDLLHRDTARPGVLSAQISFVTVATKQGSPAVSYTLMGASDPMSPPTGLFAAGPGSRPVAWLLWTSLPGAVVLVALLGLLVGIVLSAGKRGRYARRTLRLIRVAGLVGIFGGLAAAGVEALADRWTAPLGYSYSPTVAQWQLAALLGLLGCALLAVREVLGQAGELHAELETVI
jgi:hypothetical protein